MEQPRFESQTKAVKPALPVKNRSGHLDIKVLASRSVFVDEPLILEGATSQGARSHNVFLSVKGAPFHPKSKQKRKLNQKILRSTRRRAERSQVEKVGCKLSVQEKSNYDISFLEGVYTILTLKRVSQKRVSTKSQQGEEACKSFQETERECWLHPLQTTEQTQKNAPKQASSLNFSSQEIVERITKAQKEGEYMRFSEEVIKRAIQVLQVNHTMSISSSSDFAPLNVAVEKMIKRQILRRLYMAGWKRRNIPQNI
jgi:hypothetical protein